MAVGTLVFSAIAALGSVMAVIVASQPVRRITADKHRKLDYVTQSYTEIFGRLYRFAMEDLDAEGT